ncbi:MAG: hypothetical protein ACFFAO_20875 [Candidatus Hermodarchaeota archaeon]
MDIKKTAEAEKDSEMSYAIWRETNGQKYLEVYSPSQYILGVLQGQFLAKQIIHMKRIIEEFASTCFIQSNSYEKLINIADSYKNFIPTYLKHEMKGISDALPSISYDDIVLQNCFFDLIYGRFIPENIHNPIFNSYIFESTSLGIKKSNLVILAQNFNFSKIFEPCMYFSLLKMPEKPNIFSLRLGALLNLPAGYNSNNLSTTFNFVKTNVKGKVSIPTSIKSRIIFQRYKISEAAHQFIINSFCTTSNNRLISDNSKIIRLENLPTEYDRKDIKNFIVTSNTFLFNSLQKYLIDKNYSKKRQEYAEIRLKQLFDSDTVNDEKLLEILFEDPIICSTNPFEAMTTAFITRNYFGLGKPTNKKFGIAPI